MDIDATSERKGMRRQTINPRIRSEVIARYGNRCWLEMPGCTVKATEDDHIIPFSAGGKDTVPNIRRACKHCNASRQDRVLFGYGARLHMIVCPPGSCDREAVDYIAEHAKATDPVVSWSALSTALNIDDDDMEQRRAVAMAWSAAYRHFARSSDPIDVWLIRTIPTSRHHPHMLAEWIALDYDLHILDPGYEESMARARNELYRRLVRQWYSLRLSQENVEARQQTRRRRLAALGLRTIPPTATTARPRW